MFNYDVLLSIKALLKLYLKKLNLKHYSMWLQLSIVELSQVICLFLVKPNRMFGLVEASAWMHVRKGTIKMSKLLG